MKWVTWKSPGVKIRDAKGRGEWGEIRFLGKATEHGFNVAKPWGESSPYDFVVDLGGRFVSVQVKSTMYEVPTRETRQRSGCFAITLRGGGSRAYHRFDFHYLAAYVIPQDIWYIIPFALVTSRTTIEVCPGSPASKYERYREA
jgi:hypothetical protein